VDAIARRPPDRALLPPLANIQHIWFGDDAPAITPPAARLVLKTDGLIEGRIFPTIRPTALPARRCVNLSDLPPGAAPLGFLRRRAAERL
jgi:thiamine monophosphate kinase